MSEQAVYAGVGPRAAAPGWPASPLLPEFRVFKVLVGMQLEINELVCLSLSKQKALERIRMYLIIV